MQIYNACVLSTLLYGAECWTLKDRDEKRLDAFDMRCQRKILKIKWFQHIRNQDIRDKTNQPQLTKVIRKRRLPWFGHVQRMEKARLPLTLYGWTPTHGRREGRQGRPVRTALGETWMLCSLDGPWRRLKLLQEIAEFGHMSYVRQQVQECTMLSGR